MIRLIVVGKVKEKWVASGIADFAKRIKRFEVVELKDSTPLKEAKLIEEKKKGTLYLLDETGKNYSSEELASVLKKEEGDISFAIGGPTGLDPKLKEKYKLISLSYLTFTHEMARLFFTEQIYRAQSILAGKSYHKKSL